MSRRSEKIIGAVISLIKRAEELNLKKQANIMKNRARNFKFATAINCIDGRVQLPVAEFIKKNYAVEYVDMITVPGPDKVLSACRNMYEIGSLKDKLLFSYNNRDSKLIFIISHYGCLGNPSVKNVHLKQLRIAMKKVKKWCAQAKVYGIWINKEWKAVLVKE